jgi:Flp pilus assembly protein TadB
MAVFWAILSALLAWGLLRLLERAGRSQSLSVRKRDSLRSGEPTWVWLLWWGTALFGAALGAVFFDHPLLGLAGGALFPVLRIWSLGVVRARQERALESSALTFFHGLQGLLRVGISLPAALFRLSSAVDSPFTARLRVTLEGFERGRSLSACLDRLRARAGLAQTGLCLDILEEAHRKGLTLGPFLDRVLPWLEAESRDRERILGARRGALAQGVLVSVLPWGVAVLLAGSPGAWTPGTWLAAGGALSLQGTGLWALTRLSRFE